MKPELTQARLKELLHYDPETGLFTWLVSRGRSAAGSRAGTRHSEGYTQIRIDGVRRFAHRLAFLFMEGELPSEVDHRNRARGDNRWKNLRPATRQENASNLGLRSDNTSGFRGVSWDKTCGKWYAYGARGGRLINLGRYDTPEKAAAAAQAWRADNYGEFAAA